MSPQPLRPPIATNSEEEYLQVYNLDLPELSPGQLESQIMRVTQIIEYDPEAFVWRGAVHISAEQWGDERITKCRGLLTVRRTPKATIRSKAKAWS
jgi:hypothetical protein